MSSGLNRAPEGSQRPRRRVGVSCSTAGPHAPCWSPRLAGCALAITLAAVGGCRKPPPVIVHPAGGSTTTQALVAAGMSAGLQARYGCEMGGCSPGYECREETGRCEPIVERPAERGDPASTSEFEPLESASSTAFSADGTLEITGLDDRISSVPGGPAAQIAAGSFSVRNLGERDVALRPTQAELLISRACDEEPRHVSASLAVHGLREVRQRVPLAPSYSLPAHGEQEITVFFEPVEVASGRCERAAIRITFETGAERLRAAAEVWVVRESAAPP